MPIYTEHCKPSGASRLGDDEVAMARVERPSRVEKVVEQEWRRWTGIEPATEGSPLSPALKAGEPTRYSDTSWKTQDGSAARRTKPT